MPQTKAFKFRLNRLSNDASTISTLRKAAIVMHRTTARALSLVKMHYLQVYYPRHLQLPLLKLDDHALEIAFTVARGGSYAFRGALPNDPYVAYNAELKTIFDNRFRPHLHDNIDLLRCAGLSLSDPLGTAAKDLATAFLTNIRMHFCGYVVQFVRSDLQRLATARAHVPEYRRIPADLKRAWSVQIRHAVDDILLHRTGPAQLTDPAFEAGTVRDWVHQHRTVLVPGLPPGVGSLYHDLTDKGRTWIYFQHMVEIVRRTEASQFCSRRRLRSPFVLRNGFVPGHFTLDTNSAMQLLMDRADIATFKARFHQDTGIHLPGMTTKGDMCAHYSVLSGTAKPQVTPVMEARFKDAIWCFMFNLLGVGRRTKKLPTRGSRSTTA
jgi:hypothetical protein